MKLLFSFLLILSLAQVSLCMDNPRSPRRTADLPTARSFPLRPNLYIPDKTLRIIRNEKLFSAFCQQYHLNREERQKVMILLSKLDQIDVFREYLARNIDLKQKYS